jgi:hypothetical protein
MQLVVWTVAVLHESARGEDALFGPFSLTLARCQSIRRHGKQARVPGVKTY